MSYENSFILTENLAFFETKDDKESEHGWDLPNIFKFCR